MVTESPVMKTDLDMSDIAEAKRDPSKTDDRQHISEQLPPYVTQRLDDQISWYGKKAAYNKLRFRVCQIIIIVAGAVIPIINLGMPNTSDNYSIALGTNAILGGVITINVLFLSFVFLIQGFRKRRRYKHINEIKTICERFEEGDYYGQRLNQKKEQITELFKTNAMSYKHHHILKQKIDICLSEMLECSKLLEKKLYLLIYVICFGIISSILLVEKS